MGRIAGLIGFAVTVGMLVLPEVLIPILVGGAVLYYVRRRLNRN